MLHILETHQFIQSDLQTVWDFMSSPKNLATITPPHMGFDILTDLGDGKMHPGQIIEYYVKPVLQVKLHWVTEITHVKQNQYFVDEQRFGPYAFWHHQHHFKETKQGVDMFDLVHYKLPMGLLGQLANVLFVKQQLKNVFDFRFKKVNELFNKQ
jgi:ligand-binding SRPBCC domain-containing protein